MNATATRKKSHSSNDHLTSVVLLLFCISVLVLSYSSDTNTIYAKIFALFVAVTFLLKSATGKRIIFPAEFVLLSAWVAWALICSLANGYFASSLDKLLTLLQVYSISLLLINLIVWTKSYRNIWLAFIFSSVIVSALVILFPARYTQIDGRVFGTLSNSNLYAFVLLVAEMGCYYLIVADRKILFKVAYALLAIWFFYMILQSGSRKAMIVVFLAAGVFSLAQARSVAKKSPLKALALIGSMSAVLFFGGVMLVNSSHFNRFERIYNAFESGDEHEAGASEIGRLKLIEIGLRKGLENPVFGIGLDAFRTLPFDKLGVARQVIGTYSHSNLIEIFVSTGIFGFFLYYLVFIVTLTRLIRYRKAATSKEDKTVLIICIVTIFLLLIYDAAMVSYYEKATWLVISTVIATSYILKNRMSTSKHRSISVAGDHAIITTR